jgi:hypothetical protein
MEHFNKSLSDWKKFMEDVQGDDAFLSLVITVSKIVLKRVIGKIEEA